MANPMSEQAQALRDLPTSIAPLVRRHVQDAAFYWNQLRSEASPLEGDDADPAQIDKPHLSSEKREAFARLLSAHLDGIREAGIDAWPPALEDLQRWGKPAEAYTAGWAVLSAALGMAAQNAPAMTAWSELWSTLRTQRANWDTLLPALHDAWQAATSVSANNTAAYPHAWPGAGPALYAALEALSLELRTTPLASLAAHAKTAETQRSVWCAALATALEPASPSLTAI
jgi:hypothetical protein